MQQALGILGFPTYHAQQVWVAPQEHIALWNRAMAAKFIPGSREEPLSRDEWDVLLGNHMGIVDVPAAWFGPELAELYPDAKVIVTTREKEAWFRSCQAAFANRKSAAGRARRWIFGAIFLWDGRMRELIRFMDRKARDVWRFEWHDDDAKDKAMSSYDAYYDEVRARIPESKRIEFTVQEGWGPLCAHLDVPVPTAIVDGERVEVPFPRTNDAGEFTAKVVRMRNGAVKEAFKGWALRILLFAVAGYVAYPHAVSLARRSGWVGGMLV